ncbi:Ppx/GppA family phosphatase [Polyangium aurulentum]|uniref:Ppx/GppA phosphatase family protein n=1 Tax=Polyangium aurulentum TaxID=2567896 RepID=UPI0010AEA410|nr:Ppx/GppA family phosphatase [Polyangium aurulentum]UQA62128.1 Ppx/GppA family phosphatase [Polyangium aurulentum]
MTRVASIDIGTNSVLLLIAEKRDGDLVAVVDRATITRLGEGVDKARALSPDATRRTLECLSGYAEDIRAAGVSHVEAVGTSAMRDAKGGDAFRKEAARLLGVEPRVIPGSEEAALTFEGALTGLGLDAGPVTVVDIGGGSTEIVIGDAASGVEKAESLDIGSVRLTERHVRSDPPTRDELEAARSDARKTIEGAGLSPRGALVGVAGTVTTIAAYARDVVPYDGARVHGMRLSRADVVAAVEALAALPLAERRGLRAIDPKRADVIVAGGILLGEILAWSASDELVVSDRGVRWGLARRWFEARGA